MNKQVAIIATTGANYASLQAACDRLGYTSLVTSDRLIIQQAGHVILPGVGTATHAMQQLKSQGLVDVLLELTQPVLGICLGMQLLCHFLEEGFTDGLQIVPLTVKKLSGERIYPHMGWNQVERITDECPLLQGITAQDDVYYVHNYAPEIAFPYTQAICNYGIAFSSCIQYRNFFGVQFHPEKSGDAGARILKNFFEVV